MSFRRVSIVSAFAAIGVVMAGSVGVASAAEYRPGFRSPTVQFNKAPTTQTTNSFARAKHGDALSSALNSNFILQDNTKLSFGKRSTQVNSAPTRQTANSKAVSIGGTAVSSAGNSNTVTQSNTR